IGWDLFHPFHENAESGGGEVLLFCDARLTDFGPPLHAPPPANALLFWFCLRGPRVITPVQRALPAGGAGRVGGAHEPAALCCGWPSKTAMSCSARTTFFRVCSAPWPAAAPSPCTT